MGTGIQPATDGAGQRAAPERRYPIGIGASVEANVHLDGAEQPDVLRGAGGKRRQASAQTIAEQGSGTIQPRREPGWIGVLARHQIARGKATDGELAAHGALPGVRRRAAAGGIGPACSGSPRASCSRSRRFSSANASTLPASSRSASTTSASNPG